MSVERAREERVTRVTRARYSRTLCVTFHAALGAHKNCPATT